MEEKKKLTTSDMCLKISKYMPSNHMPEYLQELSKGVLSEIASKNIEKDLPLPLVINTSDEQGKFINCELNKDGNSYRSPWSNKYFPEIESSRFPASELRELELKLNKSMKDYAKFYYGPEAVSSVYIYEIGDSIKKGFNVMVLVKNCITDCKGVKDGFYDSNIFITIKFESCKISDEIKSGGVLFGYSQETLDKIKRITPEVDEGTNEEYALFAKFTCYFKVLYEIKPKILEGNFNGNIGKKVEEKFPINDYLDYEFYVKKIGEVVENNENELRENLEHVHIAKNESVIGKMRNSFALGKHNQKNSEMVKELFDENEKRNLADGSRSISSMLQRGSKMFSKV